MTQNFATKYTPIRPHWTRQSRWILYIYKIVRRGSCKARQARQRMKRADNVIPCDFSTKKFLWLHEVDCFVFSCLRFVISVPICFETVLCPKLIACFFLLNLIAFNFNATVVACSKNIDGLCFVKHGIWHVFQQRNVDQLTFEKAEEQLNISWTRIDIVENTRPFHSY